MVATRCMPKTGRKTLYLFANGKKADISAIISGSAELGINVGKKDVSRHCRKQKKKQPKRSKNV